MLRMTALFKFGVGQLKLARYDVLACFWTKFKVPWTLSLFPFFSFFSFECTSLCVSEALDHNFRLLQSSWWIFHFSATAAVAARRDSLPAAPQTWGFQGSSWQHYKGSSWVTGSALWESVSPLTCSLAHSLIRSLTRFRMHLLPSSMLSISLSPP